MKESDIWWLGATPFLALNFADLGNAWTHWIGLTMVVVSLAFLFGDKKRGNRGGCNCE
jgi:hypothetical protein